MKCAPIAVGVVVLFGYNGSLLWEEVLEEIFFFLFFSGRWYIGDNAITRGNLLRTGLIVKVEWKCSKLDSGHE